ncbi:MAG: hypothetical protein JJ902_04220 [Roseibium sp.]|nr:hypothetical protein [Roseibium sp.]
MARDEEQEAAFALSDLLSSAMFQAYNNGENARTYLYGWERRGFRWLFRFKERCPDGMLGNAWTADFMNLNRDAILSEDGRMDFNLRTARENGVIK